MWQQLVWVEAILKGSIGLLLLLVPLTSARVFGLPRPDSGFWPRLLGAALLASASAYLVEGLLHGRTQGISAGGSAAMNLVGAVLIATVAFLAGVPLARRGKAILWLAAFILAALGFVEVAYAAP